jgi:beta-lactamase class D
MRPRYVINKGIAKNLIAKSRLFVEGDDYTAVLYNPKDMSVKIEASGTCEAAPEGDDRNKIAFSFTGEQTDMLRAGYATIEIYDEAQTLMAYKDQVAIIRKNSLQIINPS